MRIPHNLDPVKKLEDTVAKFIKQLAEAVNGRLSFGTGIDPDNIDGSWSGPIVTPTVAGTNFVVAHKLGRIPVGFIVMRRDRAVDVYDGTTTWDEQNMGLRATVGDANINIFVF